MLKKIKNIPVRLLLTVAVLLALIFVVLSVHNTLGRYVTSFDGSMVIEVGDRRAVYASYTTDENASVTLEKLQNSAIGINWETSGEVKTADISVGNSSGDNIPNEDVAVRFRIFIPEETVTEGKAFTVKATVAGKEYSMYQLEIKPGTAAYTAYGDGYIYYINSAEQEEFCLTLSGGVTSEAEALFTISDKDIDTSKIKLIVETVHLNGGGL